MTVSEENRIKTPESIKHFIDHLEIPHNNRIVFSAKFGDGKTTFLKRFFEVNTKSHIAIHLFPTNYSVASNNDIFELIKYDILFDLLAKKIEFEDATSDLKECISKYANNNWPEIVKLFTPFLSMIPGLGETSQDFLSKFIDNLSNFLNTYKEEKKTEESKVLDFLDSFHDKEGSIYEENFYTQLISDLIHRLKVDGKNEVILIIDDLDRIDPDHIFRILNIFAAHQDTSKPGNKFEFDKIIVVCDLENIRSIFHHKYGTDTDFNGYIDKFYTNEVFKYSMKENLIDDTDKILSQISGNKVFQEFYDPSSYFKVEIEWLIKSFLFNDIINVRNVIKFYETDVYLKRYKLGFESRFNVNLWGIVLFNILKHFFGNYHDLGEAFNKFRMFKNSHMISSSTDSRMRLELIFLPIMTLYHQFIDVKGKSTFKLPQLGEKPQMELDSELGFNQGRKYDFYRGIFDYTDDEESKWNTLDITEMYHQIFQFAFKRGFLK
jgi:hypothetical protein